MYFPSRKERNGGNKCHVFPRLERKRISCGYHLIIRRFFVQVDFIDLVC